MPESKFVITRGPLEYNDEDEAKKEAFRLLLQNPDVKKVYVARIFGIYEVEPPKYKYKRLQKGANKLTTEEKIKTDVTEAHQLKVNINETKHRKFKSICAEKGTTIKDTITRFIDHIIEQNG